MASPNKPIYNNEGLKFAKNSKNSTKLAYHYQNTANTSSERMAKSSTPQLITSKMSNTTQGSAKRTKKFVTTASAKIAGQKQKGTSKPRPMTANANSKKNKYSMKKHSVKNTYETMDDRETMKPLSNTNVLKTFYIEP